jgi:hypothetical protein
MTKPIIYTALLLLPLMGLTQEKPITVKSKTEGFFGIIYLDYYNYSSVEQELFFSNTFTREKLDPRKSFGTNLNFMAGYFLIAHRLSLAGGVGLYRGFSRDIFGTPLINGDLRFYFTDEKNTLFCYMNIGDTKKMSFNNLGGIFKMGLGHKFHLTKKLLVSADISFVISGYSLTKERYRNSSWVIRSQGVGLSVGFYIF